MGGRRGTHRGHGLARTVAGSLTPPPFAVRAPARPHPHPPHRYLPTDGSCAFSSGQGQDQVWVQVPDSCGKFPVNAMMRSFFGSPVAVATHVGTVSNAVQWFDGIVWRGVGADVPNCDADWCFPSPPSLVFPLPQALVQRSVFVESTLACHRRPRPPQALFPFRSNPAFWLSLCACRPVRRRGPRGPSHA